MAASRHFLRFCGAAGLLGCAGAVAADVISWALVAGYDPVSDSISALAAGEASWVLDLGLWLFGAAWAAVGIGAMRWGLGGLYWTLAGIDLALLGVDVVVIALFNEYAGQTNVEADIHQYAVYALGILFALACFLVAPGLRMPHPSVSQMSRTVGVVWIILAPLLYLVPADWYGAYERGLALILVGWLAVISSLLQRAPSEASAPSPRRRVLGRRIGSS